MICITELKCYVDKLDYSWGNISSSIFFCLLNAICAPFTTMLSDVVVVGMKMVQQAQWFSLLPEGTGFSRLSGSFYYLRVLGSAGSVVLSIT